MNILKDGKEKGQVLVESAIVFPLMIFMTLGLMQLTLLQHGRVMMDYAAYAAARSGVVHSASRAPMEAAANIAVLAFDGNVSSAEDFASMYLAKVLKSLVSEELADIQDEWNQQDSWVKKLGAWALANLIQKLITDYPSWAKVKIVNPKPDDFNNANAEEFDFDCLYEGSTATSKNDDVNNFQVQCGSLENNILTVAVRYDFEMKIPFVNWVIFEAWYATQVGIELTGAIWSARYDTGNSFGNSNAMGADGIDPQSTRTYLNYKMKTADYINPDETKKRTYIKMRRALKSYHDNADLHVYKIPLYGSYSMRMHSNIFKDNVKKLYIDN